MTNGITATCDQQQSMLVVIDVQTRLLAAMHPEDRDRVIQTTGQLLCAAGLLNIPTVISEQYPRGLGPTDPGVIQQQPAICEVVEKTSFSVRGVEKFDELLAMSSRKQLVICGAEAHVCVLQTALQLVRERFDVFVVADAVCSREPSNRDNALARMNAAGVAITNAESVLFEWLGDSKHPSFREVSSLIH